jgi:SAM-dependent methyltransferase
MSRAVASFTDVLRLLTGELELFQYSASDLRERYGEAYEADAVFIFQKTEDFAACCGDDLRAALVSYREWIECALKERWAGSALSVDSEEVQELLRDARFQRTYLYALTLSTALNRSRYELLRDFREAIREHLCTGASILEIGVGNCLDLELASRYGRVLAYEKNDLSLIWLRLLGISGQVDLRIEEYRFEHRNAFDLVIMVELLEHLSDPAAYLQGAYKVLKNDGLAYLTFAVRMPQIDHLTAFDSIQQCRDLVSDNGFTLRRERCLVDTYRLFSEEDRWRLGDDPSRSVVYCCLVQKGSQDDRAEIVHSFNQAIDC